MRTVRFTLPILLIACFSLTAKAQSSGAARDFYDRGQQRFVKRDFKGAIADFTRAIEISSRPADEHAPQRLDWRTLFGGNAGASRPIVLIDPLLARAYTDRALACYLLGDVMGTIADCDRAI